MLKLSLLSTVSIKFGTGSLNNDNEQNEIMLTEKWGEKKQLWKKDILSSAVILSQQRSLNDDMIFKWFNFQLGFCELDSTNCQIK